MMTLIAQEKGNHMLNQTPTVSIGLAVYNGEKYLDEAIQSILAQTYRDFELIISDNASTDRTPEICAKYAAQDQRIRYSRNPENIGGANNENLTFTLSRGKYFRWAAHDDYLAPTLIEKCVKMLEQNPGIVLCHAANNEINGEGDFIQVTANNEGTQKYPYQRFHNLASWKAHKCEASYGLFRSDILGKTRLQQNYTNSDRTLLCELGLYGRFYQIPEPLFFKRYHEKNRYVDWRGRMAWFKPEILEQGKVTFPSWMEFFDYFTTIHRTPLEPVDKLLCYLDMIPWAVIHGKRLVKDLLVAGYMLLHTKEWRRKKYARSNIWS
jgi:glycosyltransferase involved in cell wall biosynthesis